IIARLAAFARIFIQSSCIPVISSNDVPKISWVAGSIALEPGLGTAGFYSEDGRTTVQKHSGTERHTGRPSHACHAIYLAVVGRELRFLSRRKQIRPRR